MAYYRVNCCTILFVFLCLCPFNEASHDYGSALSNSLLFFEGQRSGKLPTSQRLKWRSDSALHDGSDIKMDLVGGYYDAGDNVKFHLPMAFTTTMLAWSVLSFGRYMGPDFPHALEAIKWGTDYFLKATSVPNVVVAQVGEPHADHNCWERPEDMDTPRNSYTVDIKRPGSEVSGEIAAALASSSMVFSKIDRKYSTLLLERAMTVFQFADTYRGSYNNSIGEVVCPFYCDYNGYLDELIWGAGWLFKASNLSKYSSYITTNIRNMSEYYEFSWDAKQAGIYVLLSRILQVKSKTPGTNLFQSSADNVVCSLMPESPHRTVKYTKGGLLVKGVKPDFQNVASLSFLLLSYSRQLQAINRVVTCGNVVIDSIKIMNFVRTQVDYILGSNPLNRSYMVGYGNKFPQNLHHRGSSLPSVGQYPNHIACKEGFKYFQSPKPNPNLLNGAVSGGPDINDQFTDNRADVSQCEATTYIVAPLVGVLAYFRGN